MSANASTALRPPAYHHPACHRLLAAVPHICGAVAAVWLLCAAPLAWAQAPASDAVDQSPVVQRAKAAAVRLCSPQGQFLGCGVIVAHTAREFHVLTAEHIVRAAPQLVLQRLTPARDGSLGPRIEHRQIEVLRADPRTDLALLRVPTGIPVAGELTLPTPDDRPGPKLKSAEPPFAAWVVDWNRGDALEVRPTQVLRRHIARRDTASQAVSYWELSTASQPGMSGGGLISDSGHLLGIASGNSQQHAYYTDETEIAKFLAQ